MIRSLSALAATVLVFTTVGCKKDSEPSASNDAPAKKSSDADAKEPAKKDAAPAEKDDDAKAKGPADAGDLKPRYGQTENHDLEEVLQGAELLEQFCEYNNATLAFPFDVPVVLEDCGEANAFYDPEKHQISMCYELIESFATMFDKYAESEEMADAQIEGATMFTLYHELGHAVAHIFELPITGNEEDAVDQLATLALLSSGEDGRNMAIDGAEAFLPDEAESELQELPFWGVHSLGEQRFYNTLCLVYGQDPDSHEHMVEDDVLPRERAEQCPEEYGRVSKAWGKLLDPHLKHG